MCKQQISFHLKSLLSGNLRVERASSRLFKVQLKKVTVHASRLLVQPILEHSIYFRVAVWSWYNISAYPYMYDGVLSHPCDVISSLEDCRQVSCG
ncbi:hypothetical protein RND71_040308 [Anisodus tanguticus]|uniref:Uncharacterized protein n=1 Tax=Anisodus tanguticus TaxID=243964 RepID=A0AAE1UT69_9SOLA|nr:hypothetical protein RND71_040308 [Anisodus tanguticus]